MKKSLAVLISISALAAAAVAQGPSPAPEANKPAAPQVREQGARPGGDRPMGERGRMGPMMENREMGIERMMGFMAMSPEFSKKLNLTEEQKGLFKQLSESQRAKMMELQSALAAAAKKQADLMLADPLDEAAVMAAVEEAGAANIAMAKARVKMMIEFRKVLTDEQRKQLQQMVTEMRERRPDMARRPGEGREGGDRMRERPRENAPVPPPPPPVPAPDAAPAPAPAPAP